MEEKEEDKNFVKIEPNTVEDSKISSGYINNNITILQDDDKQEEIKGESNNKVTVISETQKGETTPIDWKPQDKCYFCVDGKLLTVNDKGELVAESGPSAQPEVDITIRVSLLIFLLFLIYKFSSIV